MESLAATGVAGRPAEFFQYLPTSSLPPQPREWFAGVTDPEIVELLDTTDEGSVDTRTADQWRDDILAAGATPNGVWGGKLMWNQTPLLIARTRIAHASLRTAVRSLFDGADPLYIHVSRKDVVPQAVSMWTAVQTQQWQAPDAPAALHREPAYDARGIAHLATILLDQERAWRQWFADESLAPVEIEFSELVADPTATTARVLSALDQDPGLAPPPPIRQQSNSRSREWVERYRDDAARLGYPS